MADRSADFRLDLATRHVQSNGVLLIARDIDVHYRHRVFFTDRLFDPANRLLRDVIVEGNEGRAPKIFLTLDEGLATAQPDIAERIEDYFRAIVADVNLVCPPMLIEGGERAKNSDVHVKEVQSRIDRYGICRHSYLMGVGGGAHLDVVGLAAATAHRGVRHVRVPTTTLAQNDSGVGVKNGINAFGKKNFIGAFAPPFVVINDFSLLTSLSDADKRAGYSEAVKVALIRDRGFFEEIERRATGLREFRSEDMRWLIHRCAELHIDHIVSGGDPFEFGSARPLDFGHWAAHKLEHLSGYTLRHGEAVAIGIALDTLYSRRKNLVKSEDSERVLCLLEQLGFRLSVDELGHRGPDGRLSVLLGLDEFREHLGGELTISLLAAIGQGVEVHEMDLSVVEAAIEELTQR